MKKIFLVIALTLALSIAGAAAQRSATQSPPQSPPAHHEDRAAAVKITDGPRVEATGPSTATIAWTTNTGGSSIVRYGTDAKNLNEMAESPYSDNEKTAAQNHRVQVHNLKPGTTYYFMVDSGQGEDTGTEAKSPVGQFTTKPR